MKAVFISFNQAYHDAILSIMDKSGLRGYTCWNALQGRGSRQGEPHYGNHAWPTLNAAILAIMDSDKVKPFLDKLHDLDVQTEQQGLRAFVWDISQTI